MELGNIRALHDRKLAQGWGRVGSGFGLSNARDLGNLGLTLQFGTSSHTTHI